MCFVVITDLIWLEEAGLGGKEMWNVCNFENEWVVVHPQSKTKKSGEAGYRSLCLMHAKHALYHLSYIPVVVYFTRD